MTNRSGASSFFVPLAAIITAGITLRIVAALVSPNPLYVSDATFFRVQGILLAQGHGFADPFVWIEQQRLVATAFHPPLFSMLLGSVHWLGFHGITAAKVASCLIGSTTILFVGLIGRNLRGNRVGLIAATIAALTPNLWVPDGALTSEGLGAALVAAALWTAYRLMRTGSASTALLLGTLIGLAALTRPETLALSGILVIPIAAELALPTRRRVAIVGVAGLATIVVVAPWVIRSATLFDEPVLFSTNGPAVIGFANCRSTYYGASLGSWRLNCPGEDARDAARTRIGADEAVVAGDQAETGVRFLRGHMSRFATAVAWARIGRSWSLFEPFSADEARQNEAKTRTEMVAGVVALWITLMFAIVGLSKRVTTRSRKWPLLMPCVITTVVSVLAYGTPRFRVIAEPGLAVLAALGVDALLRRRVLPSPAPPRSPVESPTA